MFSFRCQQAHRGEKSLFWGTSRKRAHIHPRHQRSQLRSKSLTPTGKVKEPAPDLGKL